MPLHPQSQAFVDMIAENKPKGWEEMSPEEARDVFVTFEPMLGETTTVAQVKDIQLGGVGCRLYRDHTHVAPLVMFFHGGGFVLGDLETHDALCRRLAKQSGCVVIAVDYRRSPECRFPGPLNDCYQATLDAVSQPAELKIDVSKVAVAGDSAGGNLAAAVALRSRDEDGPAIAMQLLMYPTMEPNDQTASYQSFANGYGLTRANMQWFWEQYLGDQPPTAFAAPLLAESFAGLPNTHVITAEYDVLRDEGEVFVQQLQDAGVDVTHVRYDGMLHGFIHFAGFFETGIEATHQISQWLREQFA